MRRRPQAATVAPAPDRATGASATRRQAVLRALTDAHRPLTSAEVAERLSVHKNTVRFHLESLIAAGQVEQADLVSSGPGRPAQAFRAVRGMDPGGPRFYQFLASVLTQALLAEPGGSDRAVEAGREWGRRVAATSADPITGVNAAVDQLAALLDSFGFAPECDGGTSRDRGSGTGIVAGSGEPDWSGADPRVPHRQVRAVPLPPLAVRHCPFLELAAGHQEIVCAVHLGLMRGALEAWGAPVDAVALEPFADPDRCLVHLRVDGTSDPRRQ